MRRRRVAVSALLSLAALVPLAAQRPARDTLQGFIFGARETVVITLTFSRPVALGREVLGDLVPYDVPWITGFGDPTELSTLQPITIGAARIAAGNYSLWTLPTAHGATLIVNRNRSKPYDASADVARIPLLVDTLSSPVTEFAIMVRNDRKGPDTLIAQYDRGQSAARHVEHYTIDMRPGTAKVLLITWGRFQWTAPLGVPDH